MEEVLRDVAELHQTIAGVLPSAVEVRDLSGDEGRIRARYVVTGQPEREYQLTYHLTARNNRICRIAGLETTGPDTGAAAKLVESATDTPGLDFTSTTPANDRDSDWSSIRDALGVGVHLLR